MLRDFSTGALVEEVTSVPGAGVGRQVWLSASQRQHTMLITVANSSLEDLEHVLQAEIP